MREMREVSSRIALALSYKKKTFTADLLSYKMKPYTALLLARDDVGRGGDHAGDGHVAGISLGNAGHGRVGLGPGAVGDGGGAVLVGVDEVAGHQQVVAAVELDAGAQGFGTTVNRMDPPPVTLLAPAWFRTPTTS
jgi:hypothetical protein